MRWRSGDVTLSSLRGKNVLLAFFPLTFTRVCTQEMCSLTEDYGRLAKEGLSVDLLSDLKREVTRRYGTLIEEKSGRELLAQLEKHQRSV